jgi:hypothetical protein
MNGSELDFWLGSWHARWEGGEGTNTIAREFDGKVIVERFEGRPSMELTGYSVSVFDAEADLWRQTWVDDQGSYFALTGGTEGETFVLHMSAVRGGVPVELRMVFGDIGQDSFRWVWERSTDAGATWSTAWEIAYTRTA